MTRLIRRQPERSFAQRFVFAQMPVYIGITLQHNQSRTEMEYLADPFTWISAFGVTNFIQNIIRDEVSLYPSASLNILREILIETPQAIGSAFRPSVETQISTDNRTRRMVRDETRDRSRLQISIALQIWFPSIIIAYVPLLREAFMRQAIEYGWMPTFTKELLLRTRTSLCGKYFMKPNISPAIMSVFSTLFPDWVGTFADPDVWFNAPNATARSYYSLLQVIKQHPDSPLAITQVTTGTIPGLDSGYTTTMGSISLNCSRDLAPTDSWQLVVLPGHAYGTSLNSVHVIDALLFGQTFSLTSVITSLDFITNSIVIYATKSNFTNYIVHRAFGKITNHSSQHEVDQALTPNRNPSRQEDATPNGSPFTNVQSHAFLNVLRALLNELLSAEGISMLRPLLKLIMDRRNRQVIKQLFNNLSNI